MTSRLTDELKACIGREESFTAPEPLGRAMIRLFTIATGDDNPLYLDEGAASQSTHRGIIAPPTLVCETNQMYPPSAAGEDGYFGHRWVLPLVPRTAIRGGNRYEFQRPVRPDDRITATWRIMDIYEKATRKEGMLIFIISEVRYTNQHNELLAINYDTTIQ